MDTLPESGISDSLKSFVDEAPRVRTPILAFVRRVAASLPLGAKIIDVGSGNAPFRELFAHTTYMTCDWENSIYTPEIAPDIMAPANRIPVEDAVFDGILCTDVLEHVAEPLSVLQEFHRLLKPGGLVWITVPFIWYLHEQPYDYFRYTSHGLRSLLERSGFVDIQVTPLSDAFSTVAQLTRDLGWMMGRGGDKCDGQRDLIERTMQQVAGLIGSFSDYDTQWIFPLEYSVEARRRALSFEMGSDIVDSGEGDR